MEFNLGRFTEPVLILKLKDKCVAGMDPGATGAVSFMWNDGKRLLLHTYPMPMKDGVVDTLKLSKLIGHYRPERVLVEDIFLGGDSKKKKTNPKTMGIMAKNWGRAVAAFEVWNVKIKTAYPTSWQSKMLTKSITKGDSKIRAKAVAENIFPQHNFVAPGCKKWHDGMADASLINTYEVIYGEE